MEEFDPQYLCEYISKSTATMVRVYKGINKLHSNSPVLFDVDPFLIYEDAFLRSNEATGVITTSLLQLYGYFSAHGEYRFVIGPSGILADDQKQLSELAFRLGIPEAYTEQFKRQLDFAPNIGIDRLVWFLQLYTYLIDNRKISVEEINLSDRENVNMAAIASEDAETMLSETDNDILRNQKNMSFEFETQLKSLIRSGEPERVAEWMIRFPNLYFGDMAQDTLRQIKNIGVCAAAIIARAAIEGGLDNASAFRLSDIYIQKIEMLSDGNALMKLYLRMVIDYAERVRQAKLGLETSSPLITDCARYINKHLTQPIRVSDIADAFHKGRSYLCTKFKQVSGISLGEFIRHEKIMEAQRLLTHTSRSIQDIATYLAFSSQSHFQNTFKQFTGKTPGAFRTQIRS